MTFPEVGVQVINFCIGTRSHAVDEADCCSHTRIKIASAAYMGQNFEKGER
jgi:stress-induced morphogen